MKTLAFAVMLLAQETQSPYGVVSGQIRSLSGAPAAGIRVVVMAAPNAAAAATGFSALESITETDASGRYRLERIPPGRYVVAAGLLDLPTYYPGVKVSGDARSIAITAGGTITGIDFTLTQSAGVRVSGRVTGLPNGTPAGIVRAGLLPGTGARGAGPLPEALVQADGSFEFLRIPPGSYNLRLNPSSTPITPTPVNVQNEDVGPLSLSIGPAILGRVEIEGGGSLPTPKNAPPGLPTMPSLLTLQARRSDSGGAPTPQVRADGAFLWLPPVGEYKVGVSTLPFGLSVKRMSFGAVNLLESMLKIAEPTATPPPELRITITTTPLPGEPAGVNVSGQVLGISGGPASGEFWVRMTSSTSPTYSGTNIVQQRVGETRVNDDGTFEMLRVPPGSYSTQVFPRGAPSIGGNSAIVVGDQNVRDVQLVATVRSALPAPIPTPLPSPRSPPSVLPPYQIMPLPLLPSSSSLFDLLPGGPGTVPSTEPRGVKVSGKVVVSPSGSIVPHTIVLFGPRGGSLTVQTPILSDGSFEFKNVPPGVYDARTLPLAIPPMSTRMVVELQDLTGVQISAPSQSEIRGQIALEGGGSLPDLNATNMRLQSTDGNIEIPIGADGRFAMKISQGEYRVSVSRTPTGYAIRSLTSGTTDLLRSPLTTGATTEIRITLSLKP